MGRQLRYPRRKSRHSLRLVVSQILEGRDARTAGGGSKAGETRTMGRSQAGCAVGVAETSGPAERPLSSLELVPNGVEIAALLPDPPGRDEGHEQVVISNGTDADVDLTAGRCGTGRATCTG